MALTEPRNKQNPWFQKQNHVRPAKNQVSKGFIDTSLGGGGGPPPIGANLTARFDFSNPSNYETLNNDGVNVIVGKNLAGGYDFGRDTLTNCGQIIKEASPSGLDVIHNPSESWGVGGLGRAENYPNTLPLGEDLTDCAYHIYAFKIISSNNRATAVINGVRHMSFWDIAGVGDGSISCETYGTSLALNGDPLRGDPTGYVAADYANTWVVQESVPNSPSTNGIISKQANGSRPPIGDWGEFLMYDAIPSEADRQALVQYLTAKWGVSPPPPHMDKLVGGYVFDDPSLLNGGSINDGDAITSVEPKWPGTAALTLTPIGAPIWQNNMMFTTDSDGEKYLYAPYTWDTADPTKGITYAVAWKMPANDAVTINASTDGLITSTDTAASSGIRKGAIGCGASVANSALSRMQSSVTGAIGDNFVDMTAGLNLNHVATASSTFEGTLDAGNLPRKMHVDDGSTEFVAYENDLPAINALSIGKMRRTWTGVSIRCGLFYEYLTPTEVDEVHAWMLANYPTGAA